jgi:hypothetical protein
MPDREGLEPQPQRGREVECVHHRPVASPPRTRSSTNPITVGSSRRITRPEYAAAVEPPLTTEQEARLRVLLTPRL